MILETWRVEVYQQGLIHTNGLHELNMLETTQPIGQLLGAKLGIFEALAHIVAA